MGDQQAVRLLVGALAPLVEGEPRLVHAVGVGEELAHAVLGHDDVLVLRGQAVDDLLVGEHLLVHRVPLLLEGAVGHLEIGAGLVMGVVHRGLRPSLRGQQGGEDRDREDADDHAEREGGGDLRDRVHGLAAVDEAQLVLVQRVHDELHADEGEDDRQAVGEVDQSVEQPVDEEVQLAQAQQREHRRGEHDVGVLGEAEDRRDRVEREEDVGRADGDHDQQHRGEDALAVLDGEELVAVVLVGGGQDLLHQAHEDALGVLVGVLLQLVHDHLDRGVEQDRAEEVEGPGEVVDRGGAEGDHARARDDREGDAEQQHLLLVLAGHGEAGDDD